jgi:choline dehydrogenase-like flavoprotein
MNTTYDAIIIGSGAGGSAAAYRLTQTGKTVLLLEKGPELPKDGSTLDVGKVLRQGLFKSREPWLDKDGKLVTPQEFFNLGGKTKWYGAALLRFSPHEFEADGEHQCLPWPIGYDELAPFYDEAERLLEVRRFEIELELRSLFSRIERKDGHWRSQPLPLGLAPEILDHPDEARHFDGFASVRGLKSDAQVTMLDRVKHQPNLRIITGRAVVSLLGETDAPQRITGVLCDDGATFNAGHVLLAGGALHSPRLLQTYLESNRLSKTLPNYPLVGRYYKCHLNTALMAFSASPKTDLLRKTALLLNDEFPHSSVQALGGGLAGEIVGTELPWFAPRWLGRFLQKRAYGFFLTTEDGSHPDNRVQAKRKGAANPVLNYDASRLIPARTEHRRLIRAFQRRLFFLGMPSAYRNMPLDATAHACGTLAAGRDPAHSVVDANGRVHGLENLYVVDGSVLPRSSRVNPALTIYAWALRVASLLP